MRTPARSDVRTAARPSWQLVFALTLGALLLFGFGGCYSSLNTHTDRIIAKLKPLDGVDRVTRSNKLEGDAPKRTTRLRVEMKLQASPAEVTHAVEVGNRALAAEHNTNIKLSYMWHGFALFAPIDMKLVHLAIAATTVPHVVGGSSPQDFQQPTYLIVNTDTAEHMMASLDRMAQLATTDPGITITVTAHAARGVGTIYVDATDTRSVALGRTLFADAVVSSFALGAGVADVTVATQADVAAMELRLTKLGIAHPVVRVA